MLGRREATISLRGQDSPTFLFPSPLLRASNAAWYAPLGSYRGGMLPRTSKASKRYANSLPQQYGLGIR